ncbi:MerR family transcriptional regulator [Mesorhizobium sp. Root102]|uniref:MerR family transcriptional regulator n=1 Tax=Mesorhizobium sp. Root102 TaxID=1736422 RepID=UPI000B0F090C|nr:MerR family transcriptional regulator [Mesorhizobium sp. Root102]
MGQQPPSNSGTELKISDLSRLTGVPVSTLRVWGERGLLAPRVTSAGYRIYNEDHVKQVSDIKRLRTLQGLSIAAIKAALPGEDREPPRDTHPAPHEQDVNAQNSVGAKLRSLRQARKLTIREVANQTGIAQSVLASIERTSLGVQIPEAKTLASLYGVTLTSLMATQLTEHNKEVTSASGGGQILPTLGKGLRIEQLATGTDMMDCQRWFIEPGVNSHGAYSHDGEEFVYVLFGEFKIIIEESRIHHLRQGDSIYFKSNWKHSWSNPGQTITVLVWVNTPPSF